MAAMGSTFASILTLLALCQWQAVVADYQVQIQLDAFSNPKGQIASGYCCDFRGPAGDCNCGACVHAYHCDYKFRICVERQSAPLDMDKCSTGWLNTGVVTNNQDSITFQPTATYGQWTNAENRTFTGAVEAFRLKFHVTDDDSWDDDHVVDWTETSAQFSPHTVLGQKKRKKSLVRRSTATTTTLVYEYLVQCAPGYEGETCEKQIIQKDCAGWLSVGMKEDGVYQVAINGDENQTTFVYCDMKTDAGGWIVFQRRLSNAVSFDRPMADYKRGFGNITKTSDYWLGLDTLAMLTALDTQQLRVELTDCQDSLYYRTYDTFRITNAADGYRLLVSNTSAGTAGDSFRDVRADDGANPEFTIVGRSFTALDEDHDASPDVNCASVFRGGWWYNACSESNLNGIYYPRCYYQAEVTDGILWNSWSQAQQNNGYYSPKMVEMKFRRTS